MKRRDGIAATVVMNVWMRVIYCIVADPCRYRITKRCKRLFIIMQFTGVYKSVTVYCDSHYSFIVSKPVKVYGEEMQQFIANCLIRHFSQFTAGNNVNGCSTAGEMNLFLCTLSDKRFKQTDRFY